MDFDDPDGISITFDTFSPLHTTSSTSSGDEDHDSAHEEADGLGVRASLAVSSPFSHVMDAWYLGDIMDKIHALDAATGGRVRDVLAKLRSRAYAPVALDASWAIVFCSICHRYTTHDAAHHLCRICHRMGDHTTAKCPVVPPFVLVCSFCGGQPTGHSTNDHCCVNCYARGQHNSCGTSLSAAATSWNSQSSRPTSKNATPTKASSATTGLTLYSSALAPGSATATPSTPCAFCGGTHHDTAHHRCRLCQAEGMHRSSQCTSIPATTAATSSTPPASTSSTSPDSSCAFCGGTHHDSAHHRCRRCHAQGQHRSSQCPSASTLVSTLIGPTQAIVTQYISRTKNLQDTLTSLTPWTAGASASAFLLSDMELRLRQALHRLGLWGAGSQTPIGTPTNQPRFLPPSTPATTQATPATTHHGASNSYESVVVSYREGSSVVPDRILKFMRLIMHTNVSTNAFHVVVHANGWDEKRPGMVSPKSLPPSPRTREAYQAHMSKYTDSVLVGAKAKLLLLGQSQPPARPTNGSL